jgi:hypothetical protein
MEVVHSQTPLADLTQLSCASWLTPFQKLGLRLFRTNSVEYRRPSW